VSRGRRGKAKSGGRSRSAARVEQRRRIHALLDDLHSETAYAMARNLVRTGGRSPTDLLLLAECEIMLGEAAEGRRRLLDVPHEGRDPDVVRYLLGLAAWMECETHDRDPADALALLRDVRVDALEDPSRRQRLRMARADLHGALEQYDEEAAELDTMRREGSVGPGVIARLARARLDAGRLPEALEALDEAIAAPAIMDAAHPETDAALRADLHADRGNALRGLGRLDEAESAYQAALVHAPRHAVAQAGLAHVLASRGDYDGADDYLRSILDNTKHEDLPPALLEISARIAPRVDRVDETADRIEAFLQDPDLPPKIRCTLGIALGGLRERTGEHARAFEAWRAANHAAAARFDRAGYSRFLDRIIATFPDEIPPPPLTEDPPAIRPILEQILASHPSVFGAGEVDDLFRVMQALEHRNADGNAPASYPEAISALEEESRRSLGRAYLESLRRRIPEDRRADVRVVTDKMPHNFAHLGFVRALLPGARVVLCRRHPLDTCLSCFATNLSAAHPYAHDLGDLAFVYREHDRIVKHWQETLGLPILDLRYEQLVAEPERRTRDLLAFADLPWDDACLAFHDADRTTATASADQVNRPIYTDSVGRFARFGTALDPLREALADLVDEHEQRLATP